MKVLTRRDYIQVSKSSKASDPPRPMWMGITPARTACSGSCRRPRVHSKLSPALQGEPVPALSGVTVPVGRAKSAATLLSAPCLASQVEL